MIFRPFDWRYLVCRELSQRAPTRALAATDQGHVRGHQSHELHVGIQRKAGHVKNGICHVAEVHPGLGHNGAVGLQGACGEGSREFGGGIADVDLTAGDVLRASLQGYGLGETR